MSNRVEIQPLNPKDNSEKKRPQTGQADDRENSEGFFGRICKKLKSAFLQFQDNLNLMNIYSHKDFVVRFFSK